MIPLEVVCGGGVVQKLETRMTDMTTVRVTHLVGLDGVAGLPSGARGVEGKLCPDVAHEVERPRVMKTATIFQLPSSSHNELVA